MKEQEIQKKVFCSNKNCTYRMCKFHTYNINRTDMAFICDLRHVTKCKLKGENNKNYHLVVSDALKAIPKERKRTRKTKTKKVMDLTNQIVYESVHAASLKTRISEDNIRKCCRGLTTHACGRIWIYVDGDC